MDFIDQLKQFSTRVDGMKGTLQTEEATKTALIMPFFSLLGYDVFNPQEFMPEFTADVGTKKGEKVDYAIMEKGEPIILIEAKSVTENLGKHDSQLFRYFGTTCAKFAILTNGVIYKFYTDLDTPNKMDLQPFLEIDILDTKEAQVAELKKFHKTNFDVEAALNSASELKYTYAFKEFFSQELQSPSDDLLKLFLSNVYDGMKTQAVLDKFRPILKQSMSQHINEMMSDKIKSAFSDANVEPEKSEDLQDIQTDGDTQSKIITTPEEMESFYAVKSILADAVEPSDLTYKDTENYFSICYRGMVTKWICRLHLNGKKRKVQISTPDKTTLTFTLHKIDDLYQYRQQLCESVLRFTQNKGSTDDGILPGDEPSVL